MLTILRHRAFGMVWLAGLISETGDWLLITGLPIFVFTLTNSSLVTSTVFLIELVPSITLGTVAGVLVDRWNRRRLLITINLAQAGLLLPLLLVHSTGQLWVLYLIAAAQAVLTQFAEPARNALLPSLVNADQVITANTAVALSANVGRLVGSSLGGLAVVGGGLTGVVVGDTASFLAGAVLVAGGTSVVADLARATARTPGDARTPLRAAWRDGLHTITADSQIRTVFTSAAIGAMAQGLFVVLFIVFVSRVLHGSGAEIGVLRGVQAVGGILGGIVLGATGVRLGARRLVTAGAFGCGLVSLMLWNAPLVTLAEGIYIGLFVVIGIPVVAYSSGLSALVQQRVPADHLGRAFGTLLTVQGGCQALGMLAAGALGDRVNVVVLLNIQACLYVLAAVLPVVWRGNRSDDAGPVRVDGQL
jgi:MFS family permease